MMPDRRMFLGGMATAAMTTKLSALAPERGALLGTLQDLADALLAGMPEQRTSLGLDRGRYAAAKSRLNSQSPARFAHDVATLRSYRTRLASLDRSMLNPADRIEADSVSTALDLGIAGSAFAFGDNSFGAAMGESARPYVVTQSSGAVFSVPEFLDSQHSIAVAGDADAYLARLAMLGSVIDQETTRIRTDTAAGVIAPDFILDNAIGQITRIRATPASQQKLVVSIARRTAALHILGNWSRRAETSVVLGVFPALDRQLSALREARARANADAGVWKLKNGEAYYAWLLSVGTTTRLTAAEIHQIGIEQDRELEARMDAILKGQGLTKGTVAERTQALTRDPKNLFADNDAGRDELIAYLNQTIANTRPRLARMSKLGLKAPVIVKRVPVDIQDGAAQGYMNFGSLDGARPSIYYINLKSMENWPRFQLPTLTAHETIPGHAWQGAYIAEHHDQVPLINSIMGFNGFIEGWALYAEQLNDEFGAYVDDPLGKLGYLQAQRFRAGRLVVDTGLHASRWTRDQAVEWLMASTGRARNGVTSEIDRYCATPGQACGYKVGHNEILRLRTRAQGQLGARFDIRDFNDVVVSTTGVPLTVLATAIDAYIARTGSRGVG
ncbi:DUF885 family protein [Sphingomonas sp. CROZ-RG-20F-R02-07]|uniref:DUF885 domain-containing protein n=1 Tax=Sphingomonas sp. CROZ-RG-20F-R02-07 TaxID=2914832 RepID=UPI001F5680F5|nr:DUF885 family protein [Sphingomonas sp. CROZ-RG-20F-R02-07]